MTTILETDRLILRTWKEEDAQAYYEINQDQKIIEFLPGPLTMKQVKDFVHRAQQQYEKRGFTLWAVELKATSELIGFIGLNDPDFSVPSGLPFSPTVEIGWRLRSHFG